MSFDITAFRSAFPEFSSETDYPTETITFWSNLGDKMLNVTRWGDFLTEGLQLFTAHYITLAMMNANTPQGAIPGRGTAMVSSQGVGGVSVNFDNSASLEEGAGQFNETLYGRQFIQLARLVGMGGAQL